MRVFGAGVAGLRARTSRLATLHTTIAACRAPAVRSARNRREITVSTVPRTAPGTGRTGRWREGGGAGVDGDGTVSLSDQQRRAVSNVGARLRRRREEAGLSLRQFARSLGVSASFVSQLENGKSQPSVATLYLICNALELSIDELFTPEQPPDPAERDRTDGAPAGQPVDGVSGRRPVAGRAAAGGRPGSSGRGIVVEAGGAADRRADGVSVAGLSVAGVSVDGVSGGGPGSGTPGGAVSADGAAADGAGRSGAGRRVTEVRRPEPGGRSPGRERYSQLMRPGERPVLEL